MASIEIRHSHRRPLPEARDAVGRIAGQLEQRFALKHDWLGDDAVRFHRPGVDGRIRLEPGEIHVTAELGFMLAMMKGRIESEIRGFLDREFT